MVGEIEPCGVRFAWGDTFLTCPVTVLLCNYFILSHFESMSCQISISVDYFVTWINIKWYWMKDKKDRTGPEIKLSTHKRTFRSHPVWLFMRCILYPRDFEYISYWKHDDVIEWKHFPRYWPFVRGIHQSPVNSPHKGQCMTQSYGVSFDLRLNKQLSKQSWG